MGNWQPTPAGWTWAPATFPPPPPRVPAGGARSSARSPRRWPRSPSSSSSSPSSSRPRSVSRSRSAQGGPAAGRLPANVKEEVHDVGGTGGAGPGAGAPDVSGGDGTSADRAAAASTGASASAAGGSAPPAASAPPPREGGCSGRGHPTAASSSSEPATSAAGGTLHSGTVKGRRMAAAKSLPASGGRYSPAGPPSLCGVGGSDGPSSHVREEAGKGPAVCARMGVRRCPPHLRAARWAQPLCRAWMLRRAVRPRWPGIMRDSGPGWSSWRR